MGQSEFKVLVSRPDRLGDVILSTPVLEALKTQFPSAKVSFLVRSPVEPILKDLPLVDEVLVFDPEGRHRGFSGWLRLVTELRERKFQTLVALQSHQVVASAAFFAGVRERIGPLSSIHSWLFYNRGIRQRRSRVEMHEAEYNLQLLEPLGIRSGSRFYSTHVQVSEGVSESARSWLLGQGWSPHGSSLVIVHPGMGGSALNWPFSHYCTLVNQLLKQGLQVLVTGGPEEVALLEQMENQINLPAQGNSARLLFFKNREGKAVAFLAGLFKQAHLVVAPSTGPLHLAVALGVPVVTFFPPIRVQSARRWGPYLNDSSRARVLVPGGSESSDQFCGETFRCRGASCPHYPCMESLTVDQALTSVLSQLRALDGRNPTL